MNTRVPQSRITQTAAAHVDLVVLGAGPAGVEAAITAAEAGLSVCIHDEMRDAGGQVFRAPATSKVQQQHAAKHRDGDLLRERLRNSRAIPMFEHLVWHVGHNPDGSFDIASLHRDGMHNDGVHRVRANALIVATGAIERVLPRPGWTLPGVVGLAAATVMLKAHGVLPGQRVVVAGPGPLAPLVAALVIESGGEVVAMVDPLPRSAWASALPSMASRPDLLWQGARWLIDLARRGIPIYRGWDVARIEGQTGVERVVINRPQTQTHRNNASSITLAADALCLGDGLVPGGEIYRLLGAPQRYAPELGGWVPELDKAQRTRITRLYAAGDGAGIRGGAAAPISGRIAALSAACDLDRISADTHAQAVDAALRGAKHIERFGTSMAAMMRARPQFMQSVPDDTIACRCEDVSVGELRRAIAEGITEINALKSATRCGMGPCGGRFCGEAAASLFECAGISRETCGQFTVRPPLRPIPISAITGDFSYADVPIPELSPA